MINIEKFKIKELTITESILLYALTGSALLIIGIVMNFIVISANEGRMPVLLANWHFEDTTHFTFSSLEASDVHYSFLGDIFHISILYFSIGDVFIVSSVILIFINMISFLYFLRKRRKRKND